MRTKFTFSILTVCAVFFIACNGGSPAPIPTPAVADFKCKIGGATISTTNTTAIFQNNTLSISGDFGSGKSVTLLLSGVSSVTPSTYFLTVTGSVGIYIASTSAAAFSTTDANASGTVNISSVDTIAKTIAGTFSFTAKNASTTAVVTEGSFTNVAYTKPTYVANNNIIGCKVDGFALATTKRTAVLAQGKILLTAEAAAATQTTQWVTLLLPPNINYCRPTSTQAFTI